MKLQVALEIERRGVDAERTELGWSSNYLLRHVVVAARCSFHHSSVILRGLEKDEFATSSDVIDGVAKKREGRRGRAPPDSGKVSTAAGKFDC